MSVYVLALAQLAILAYALVGGVFLAFSDFIMRSLARTSGVGGVEAMQVINREVFRWITMTLFLGLAGISLFLTVYGVVIVGGAAGTLMTLAGSAYVVGCFGITVFCNVPMNETLESLELSAEGTQAYWTETYLPRWTFWNSVRAVACAVSAALLLFALVRMSQAPLS